MYVVYKPIVVNPGDQQTTPVTSQTPMVQYQPVQISNNVQSNMCQPLQLIQGVQGQQFIQTPSVIQGQNVIQGVDREQNQSKDQQLIQNPQQLMQNPLVIGQPILQMPSVISGGQNLLFCQPNSAININQSPINSSIQGLPSYKNQSNISVQHRQIKTEPSDSTPIQHGDVKKEPDKSNEDLKSVQEKRLPIIKPEVIDPEYDKSIKPSQKEEDNTRVFPTGLIIPNKCISNNTPVSGSSFFIKQEDISEIDSENEDGSSPSVSMYLAANWAVGIWNNWACTKDPSDPYFEKPLFYQFCKQITNKSHFLDTLKKFICDLKDPNGQPVEWKTIEKVVKNLEAALKRQLSYRWREDINLIEAARSAVVKRLDDSIKNIGVPAQGYSSTCTMVKPKNMKNKTLQEILPRGSEKPTNSKNKTVRSDCSIVEPVINSTPDDQNQLKSVSSCPSVSQNPTLPVIVNQIPFVQNVPVLQTASLTSPLLMPFQPLSSLPVGTNMDNTISTASTQVSSGSHIKKTTKAVKRGNEQIERELECPTKKIKEEPSDISDEEKNSECDDGEKSVGSSNEEISQKKRKTRSCNDKKTYPTESEPRFKFIDDDVICINENNEEKARKSDKTVKNDNVVIDLNVPDNTMKNNNWATNTWNDWAKARNKIQTGTQVPLLHDLYKNVSEPELNELLTKFIYEARNNSGEPYPPNSLRSLVSGFQRILRQTGWTNLSLLDTSQVAFKEFHNALDARCKELFKQGIGIMKKQALIITEQQELSLWEKQVFSFDTGWGLTYAVYFYTSKVFCVGSAYELWKLKLSQFTFGEDEIGKFVEFKSRCGTGPRKNKPIKQYRCHDNPRTYYTIIEKYFSLIPKVDDIFFLRPDDRHRLRFTKTPLGKNTLDSFVSKMMKQAGYRGYYTNHSIKATMAAKMYRQGYQEEFIQERTGHISTAVKKYNKGVQNAEEVRASISSTLDPPHPKKMKKSKQVVCENYLYEEKEAVNKVIELEEQIEKQDQKQNEYVHELENQTKTYEDVQASSQISQQEIEILQREKEKQNKEIMILKKTVDEMELRIETQKQTLCARDESMKKLLEMLQSKGLSVQKIEENQLEMENLQTRQLEDDRKIKQLHNTVSQKESEITKVKEEKSKLSEELEQSKLQLKQQPSSTHTMQAILEAKDSRISALEKEVQSLEDKLMTLQEEGSVHFDRKDKDSVSSREKTLKVEVELFKKETTRKDQEILALKMKKETLEKQQTEHQQYIKVLKEQITAKDQQVIMIQGDIDELRDRVKDKDSTIDRKSQKSHSLQSEKRKIEYEVTDLKEQIEIKDRRISNLQTQIEALESTLQENETQLEEAKAKLESHDSDNKILSLEESLSEKEKQIERLKEQKVKSEEEHQEELEVYSKSSQDLKTRLDTLQLELNEKQTELVELREQSTEAQSVKFQADSKLRQLESSLGEKTTEVDKLNKEIEELKNSKPDTKPVEEVQKQVDELSSQLEQSRTEATQAQTEVDRLQTIVKESENEKNEKENQIKELQELIKEYKQKVGTLKRKQSMEKKNSATMLEEARKREDSLYDDATQLETTMKSKNERIEELEEALKESVKITAEREMVMVDLQSQLEEAEKKVDELTMDLVKMKSESSGKADKMNKILEEKDIKLKKLHAERHKHLEEVFEMKQEAILAAMSEKDANIALLEMTSSKKQKNTEEIEKLNKEKEKLQQQLSDVTHNRMKLIQKQERREEKKKSSLPRKKKESTPEKSDSQPEPEQPSPPTVPTAEVDS